MNTIVIGAGAWGTTLANLIAYNSGNRVLLWAYEEYVIKEINAYHENKTYLPGIKLHKNIIAISKIPSIEAKFIFLVTPSQNIYLTIKKVLKSKLFIKKNKDLSIIICSKGIDLNRKELLSVIVKDFFPEAKISVLSGPSFARELAMKLPTAVTLASETAKNGRDISRFLSNNYFRVYLSNDICGVQISGALKNILAIAAGITEGLDLGNNARAAIISRGIKEIIKIVKKLGGKEKTVLGLAGLGDILLTSTSKSSRNYNYGYSLGKGRIRITKVKNKKQVTEGVENIKVIYYLKKKMNIDTPIIDSVYNILVKGKNINKIVKELLDRPIKVE